MAKKPPLNTTITTSAAKGAAAKGSAAKKTTPKAGDNSKTFKFDKSKLPSRHVTEGPSRAPHRSYYYAMGMTAEQIHRPLVGVVSCWNEAAPCNIALMRQAQSAKKGVDLGFVQAGLVLEPHTVVDGQPIVHPPVVLQVGAVVLDEVIDRRVLGEGARRRVAQQQIGDGIAARRNRVADG